MEQSTKNKLVEIWVRSVETRILDIARGLTVAEMPAELPSDEDLHAVADEVCRRTGNETSAAVYGYCFENLSSVRDEVADARYRTES